MKKFECITKSNDITFYQATETDPAEKGTGYEIIEADNRNKARFKFIASMRYAESLEPVSIREIVDCECGSGCLDEDLEIICPKCSGKGFHYVRPTVADRLKDEENVLAWRQWREERLEE